MTQIYKPGIKLSSRVCKTQIMILRIPAVEMEIFCGGLPMVIGDPAEFEELQGENNGTLVGKRYTDETETMEFLCTRGREGTIAVSGHKIDIKSAKKLPSSD
jgi:hypothetical protein